MSEYYEATGKVVEMGEIQKFAKFEKRDVVFEIAKNPEYPQFVKVEFGGKSLQPLESINAGDVVSFNFEPKGRKYVKDGETKYFTSIAGWGAKLVSPSQEDQQPPLFNQPAAASLPPTAGSYANDNEIPF